MPTPDEQASIPEAYVPTHDEILREIARITLQSALYEVKLHKPARGITNVQMETFIKTFNFEGLVSKHAQAFVATYNDIVRAEVKNAKETPQD